MNSHIDPEMRQLLTILQTAVVPRHRRRAAVHTNYHSPYYSANRYRYI